MLYSSLPLQYRLICTKYKVHYISTGSTIYLGISSVIALKGWVRGAGLCLGHLGSCVHVMNIRPKPMNLEVYPLPSVAYIDQSVWWQQTLWTRYTFCMSAIPCRFMALLIVAISFNCSTHATRLGDEISLGVSWCNVQYLPVSLCVHQSRWLCYLCHRHCQSNRCIQVHDIQVHTAHWTAIAEK